MFLTTLNNLESKIINKYKKSELIIIKDGRDAYFIYTDESMKYLDPKDFSENAIMICWSTNLGRWVTIPGWNDGDNF